MPDKNTNNDKKSEITVEQGAEHTKSPMADLVERHGVTEEVARQAVADTNREARVNELEGRLAILQAQAHEEKPVWKYFAGGNGDSLTGSITTTSGFDLEEFLMEMWVFSKLKRFEIPGLCKLAIDCGIIAYLVINEVVNHHITVSANNSICPDVYEFKIRRVR